MRPLYKINEKMQDLFNGLENLVDENGEILTSSIEQYNIMMDKLKLQRSQKVINTALYIKNLEAEKQARKDAIDYQKKAIAKLDRQIQVNQSRLEDNIKKDEIFADIDCRIKWNKSKRVNVSCSFHALPEHFQKVSIAPDKIELKKAIDSGQTVDGVSLDEHWTLNIK